MRLDKTILNNAPLLHEKGYLLPKFSVEEMQEKTHKAPTWLHFGAGNIFRAYHANLAQRLLNDGEMEEGVIVAEGYDYEIIKRMYRPHDNIGALVTLRANGKVEKTIVASIAESLSADPESTEDWERLKEIFASPTLQMVTLTITEKGYATTSPGSIIYKIATLLHHRYSSGRLPIAMVSTDNCSHNGDRLCAAVSAVAKAWEEHAECDKGFTSYLSDKEKVSFPLTMIDKITPRPDERVMDILSEDGLEQLQPIVTEKNTYVAPFVNAEECEYLVVEDVFPNGHPPLERVGVLFTDRETVDKVERMKVCTCLNPLHTCLAVFGCLLGYRLISDEMKDQDLRYLVEELGYREGLPVVTNPEILSPRKFIDEVVTLRIPNPFMPDTPQRIATDTSQKLPIRFGETIKAYLHEPTLHVEGLRVIPLIFAGWLRYLMGVDDEGHPFTLSPDPLLDELKPYFANIHLGDSHIAPVEEALSPLLHRKDIFGVDLYDVDLAQRVLRFFMEMIEAPGAVRRAIQL